MRADYSLSNCTRATKILQDSKNENSKGGSGPIKPPFNLIAGELFYNRPTMGAMREEIGFGHLAQEFVYFRRAERCSGLYRGLAGHACQDGIKTTASVVAAFTAELIKNI